MTTPYGMNGMISNVEYRVYSFTMPDYHIRDYTLTDTVSSINKDSGGIYVSSTVTGPNGFKTALTTGHNAGSDSDALRQKHILECTDAINARFYS